MLQQPVTALKLGDPDDGDYGRQQRGLMIAAVANITKDPWGYRVPAQSRSGSYLVNFDRGPYCTCLDFQERQKPCKHIYATEVFLRREEYSDDLDDAEMKPVGGVRMTQPWQAYNTAQVHEGELFETLLRELCNTVPQPPQTNGASPAPFLGYALRYGPESLLNPLHPQGHVGDSKRCIGGENVQGAVVLNSDPLL